MLTLVTLPQKLDSGKIFSLNLVLCSGMVYR